MSTPPRTQVETKHSPGLSILVYATVTLLAVRWTGYAALPFLVIFAPLLTAMAVLSLAVLLAVVAGVVEAAAKRGE